jgi:hypothetical protein
MCHLVTQEDEPPLKLPDFDSLIEDCSDPKLVIITRIVYLREEVRSSITLLG